MAATPVLDLDRLTAPISEAQPAGIDLKSSDTAGGKLFQALKDARNDARELERRATSFVPNAQVGDESSSAKEARPDDGPPKPPDWRKVRDLARDILERHSKDLRVTAWLIEAVVRLHGFAGLRDGLKLSRLLCERYWDGIHPRPDDDGIATTVFPIGNLNDKTLLDPISAIPLTDSSTVPACTGADYQYVHDPGDLKVSASRRSELDTQLQASAKETSAEFFEQLTRDVLAAGEELRLLSTLLDQKCGKAKDGTDLSPSLSQLRQLLDASAKRVKHLSNHLAPGTTNVEEQTDGESAPAQAKSSIAPSGRDEALRNIEKIAEFFERTEPHSPVSYSLRQAVKWGRMKLPELLAALIENADVRTDLGRVTGVRIPAKEENQSG